MNWPHLHLALNHVPVLGTVFVALLLATGILKRSEEIKRLSLLWFALLAVASIAIKFTGDLAVEQVQEQAWYDASAVEVHERAADQATTAMFLLGIAAGVGIWLNRRKPETPTWVVALVLILAIATGLLMVRTAFHGGQLRHSEIVSTFPHAH